LLVGCATEDVNEDLTGLVPEGLPADILEEDLDNIESQTDFPEEDGALAGQATGVPGTASISPNELEKGDALTITTSPSEAGFFDRAILYKGGKYFENFLICDNVVNRRCKDSAETSYTIPLNWVAGDYVLKVYDWATHKFIEFNFKVIAGEDNVFEPAEFKVMPASVKPGDSIRILANPKSTTYYWRAMFYKDNKYISAAPKRFCSNFNCGDSGMIIYEVPSNWAGEYKARMYYKNEQGKWTVEMKNFSVEGEPECYNSSDCPESTISEPYCNAQGQACDDSINYVCSNAGTTEASCEAEQKICENCNDGCIDGTCSEAQKFCYYIDSEGNQKPAEWKYFDFSSPRTYQGIITDVGSFDNYCNGSQMIHQRCSGPVYYAGGVGESQKKYIWNCNDGCNSETVNCNVVINQNATNASTCTPGLTGNIKCEKHASYDYWYAGNEYQNADCSMQLMDKKGCAYGEYSCQEGMGCCKVEFFNKSCSGNIAINQTKNSCTGEVKSFELNCSAENSYYTEEPMVCIEEQGVCGDSCTSGSEIFVCRYFSYYDKYSYNQYTCNAGKYTYAGSLTACPEGTTCQLFGGKNNGLCQ